MDCVWLAMYNDGTPFLETDHNFECANQEHQRGIDHGFKCVDQDRLASFSWGTVENDVFIHKLSMQMKGERKLVFLRRHVHEDVIRGGPHSIIYVLGFTEKITARRVAKSFTAILPNGTIFLTDNLFDIQWP